MKKVGYINRNFILFCFHFQRLADNIIPYLIIIQSISVKLSLENLRYCIYLSSLLYHISLRVFTVSTAIKHIAHFVKYGFGRGSLRANCGESAERKPTSLFSSLHRQTGHFRPSSVLPCPVPLTVSAFNAAG